MKSIKLLKIWSNFLIVVLVFAVAPASAQDKGKPQVIVDSAVTTLTNFTSNPGFQKHIKHAKGIFIVPRLMKVGGGNGVLLSRVTDTRKWSYPAFYSMDSVASGLQADVDKVELVLLVMTDKAMKTMFSGKFKPGVDASVAAGSIAAASADILQFSAGKEMPAGLTVKGANIAVHKEWNKEYYGRGVLTADILIEHSVQVVGADSLRRLVASTAK